MKFVVYICVKDLDTFRHSDLLNNDCTVNTLIYVIINIRFCIINAILSMLLLDFYINLLIYYFQIYLLVQAKIRYNYYYARQNIIIEPYLLKTVSYIYM